MIAAGVVTQLRVKLTSFTCLDEESRVFLHDYPEKLTAKEGDLNYN